MAGYNFAQNIIGLNKTNGDIHELEVEVANLSASVLSIGEDVSQLNSSILTIKGDINDIDYDEGSSGVWKWKKYKNGRFELFGNSEDTETQETTAWGTIHSLNLSGLGNYPFAISTIDNIFGTVTIENANGVSSVVYLNSLTTAPNYIFVRGTNMNSGDYLIHRQLYVAGTYSTT